MAAPDPVPPSDQLTTALIDGARVLARSTISALPALGRMEVRMMLRHPGAQLAVVVNVDSGAAELVAFAPGSKPLRAPLR